MGGKEATEGGGIIFSFSRPQKAAGGKKKKLEGGINPFFNLYGFFATRQQQDMETG